MKKTSSLLVLVLVLLTSSLKAQFCAIHVDSINGADIHNCGSPNTPCRTINYGITTAVSVHYTNVQIKAGVYPEAIELADGINLWGGFDAQWQPTGATTVTGGMAANGEFYAVNGDSINTLTVLSDLIINAPNATTPGKSSYGVHLVNSTGVKLQRVSINGGAGANGTNGIDGADATDIGGIGSVGGNSAEFNTTCNSSDSGPGGIGGVVSGHPTTAGGNGGRGGFMDTNCGTFSLDLNATDGQAGSGASVSGINYGGGGTAGLAAICGAGANGADGHTVHGTGGTGAATSVTAVGNYWETTVGTNGTLGEDGTGGGGGGGSGGCDDGTDSYGAGGGGGGSGGVAAPASGTGGMSGGNSAAVFLLTSACSLVDCQITLGSGGAGGNGGKSGLGTPGGIGGIGGVGAGTGNGGNGGNGGAGGNSGAGGGGGGGSVYAIYGENSLVQRSVITITGGSAGLNGTGGTGSSGAGGTDGVAGSVSLAGGNVTDSVATLTAEQNPCMSTGINNMSANLPVVLYPNPVSDELNISAASAIERVDVYSITGALQITSFKNKVNTSALAAGNYFVKVYCADGLAVKEFIKN